MNNEEILIHTHEVLQSYINFFNYDESHLDILQKQIDQCDNIADRKNFTGHITASGLVINSNKEFLVVYHNKLKKYIQPGGHFEHDDSIWECAAREVQEETGLKSIVLHNWHKQTDCPVYIDTHFIPENPVKGEKEHYHHDFIYMFFLDNGDVSLDTNEVSDFKWIPINQKTGEELLDTVLARIVAHNMYDHHEITKR